jgi:hypothetical protein
VPFFRLEAPRVPARRGDRSVAQTIAERCENVTVLHDRALGRGLPTADIAVAPSGVFVIDSRPSDGPIRISRPPFGPAKLRIGGVDRTSLVEALDQQVAAVARALALIDPQAAVSGVVCFIGDESLPVLRTLTLRGVPLLDPRGLVRRLRRRGPLTGERAQRIADELAELLPAASELLPAA